MMKKISFLLMCIVSVQANAWSDNLFTFKNTVYCLLGVDCVFYPLYSEAVMGAYRDSYHLQTGEYTCHIVLKNASNNMQLQVKTYLKNRYGCADYFELKKENPATQDISRSFTDDWTHDGFFLFSASVASRGWFSSSASDPKTEITINCKKNSD